MKKREIYTGQMDWEALGGERGEWEERPWNKILLSIWVGISARVDLSIYISWCEISKLFGIPKGLFLFYNFCL